MICWTRPDALRFIVLAVATLALCVIIVLTSLNALYPSTAAAIRFLGYVFLFNLFPGLVFYRFILPKTAEAGVYFAFALGLGITLNVLAVILLWPLGQLSLLFLLPLAASGVVIADLFRARFAMPVAWKGSGSGLYCIGSTAFFCSTALVGLGFLYTSADPESYSMHTAFEAVIIRGLEVGWPPPNFLFPNAPWSYNYAAHLWLLGINVTTGVSIDVLVIAYGPALLGAASAVLMVAFARSVVGLSWWISYLAVLCVYWVVGIAPVSGAVFASFMPYGANLILSPFLAIILFFLILAFVLEQQSRTVAGRSFRIAVLIALAFLATGARGVCTPIVLCALVLRLTVSAWRKEGTLAGNAVDLVATMIGFAAGMQFFFTAGDGFSGAGTVKIAWQPFTFLASQDLLTLPHMLMKIGVGRIPAGMIGFAVIAMFQAAFLTPALPACLLQMRGHLRGVDILLLGCGIAGLSGFFLTQAPEFSHISFLYFSNISFVLLAGRGLQLMIEGKVLESVRQRHIKVASYVAIVLLGCLHLAQVPLHTIVWLGRHWSEAAISLVKGPSVNLPQLSSCMKQEDADLFARAAEGSSAAIVIPIYRGTHCASIWWVARHPIRTLNAYMMQHVPGRATDPALQAKIETQRQHVFHAFESASKGVLDLADVVAIAATLIDKGPVFVMAPRALSVEPTESLRLIGSSEAFSLWRVSFPQIGK
ncbi:hypothetical protein [Bradyrhizobium sp. AUGA SZCCT0283]|uniref:hypothetical protein n=1 Tax=Bradyrhizobium sp. AUGA SZCCT0283 TaxID=2807671 RepID=UPI001BA730EE|nr:hypothetical protein [Bradyrhizobium sp. AUGA SZCCT0283]MBR1277684.1 hypothetical protein [Bradyrhizobium sp. AUGA SZCCT0283]